MSRRYKSISIIGIFLNPLPYSYIASSDYGLLAKGNNNHYEIASILQVSRPTISRDIEYLRQQARVNIRRISIIIRK